MAPLDHRNNNEKGSGKSAMAPGLINAAPQPGDGSARAGPWGWAFPGVRNAGRARGAEILLLHRRRGRPGRGSMRGSCQEGDPGGQGGGSARGGDRG